jgi:hypothetical protein
MLRLTNLVLSDRTSFMQTHGPLLSPLFHSAAQNARPGFATAEVLCGERRPSFLLKVADCATFCHIKVSLASSKSNAFLCAEPESQKQQGCQGLSHQELVGK